MARYMGPTTSINHILHKLVVIFGTIAFFEVLMQTFFIRWARGVSSFARRLGGTLNNTQLQCLQRMMDLEAQQCLKDHFFHGVRKHICDSAWYFYSIPGVLYFQLMIVAQKVESESEETQDCLRARVVVTTEAVEEMAKLKQQITQLMAALVQTGWGNGHTSTLSSPQKHGSGGCSHSCLGSHNGWGVPGKTT